MRLGRVRVTPSAQCESCASVHMVQGPADEVAIPLHVDADDFDLRGKWWVRWVEATPPCCNSLTPSYEGPIHQSIRCCVSCRQRCLYFFGGQCPDFRRDAELVAAKEPVQITLYPERLGPCGGPARMGEMSQACGGE